MQHRTHLQFGVGSVRLLQEKVLSEMRKSFLFPSWLTEGFTVIAFQNKRKNGLKVSCRKAIKSNLREAFSIPLKSAWRGQKMKIFYLDSWIDLSYSSL